MRDTRGNLFTIALLALLIFSSVLPSVCDAGSSGEPSYWIKKLSTPDRPVMTPSEIDAFNAQTAERVPQLIEPVSMDGYTDRADLLAWLLEEPLPSSDEGGVRRFDVHGEELSSGSVDEIYANMNIEWVEEKNPVRFGVVTDIADVRAFPTDEPAFKSPSSEAFDMFQYSSAYPAEPATLLHTSADGLWGFFQLRTVRGWMRLDKVAFGSRSDAEFFASNRLFIAVTGNRVDVYADKALSERITALPMGTVLPLAAGGDGGKGAKAGRRAAPERVFFPQRMLDGTLMPVVGYISPRADVSIGYLPYTRRNTINQAFKMLAEEYGWGGRDGNRDCSEFIRQVFASMGLRLPRNSGQQMRSGLVKASSFDGHGADDLRQALKDADPGVTLIGMSGHIMLYIGKKKSRQYVIHQVYAYKVGSRLKVVNKAEVTSLDIGKGTSSGPLGKRVRSVTAIVPFAPDKNASVSDGKGDRG